MFGLFAFFFQDAAPPGIPGWTSLGVGGIVAGLILYFYHIDRKDCAARHSEREKAFQAVAERSINVVENNTVAQVELKGAVGSLQQSIETRQRRYEREADRH